MRSVPNSVLSGATAEQADRAWSLIDQKIAAVEDLLADEATVKRVRTYVDHLRKSQIRPTGASADAGTSLGEKGESRSRTATEQWLLDGLEDRLTSLAGSVTAITRATLATREMHQNEAAQRGWYIGTDELEERCKDEDAILEESEDFQKRIIEATAACTEAKDQLIKALEALGVKGEELKG